jgi:hypothetical protein
METVEQKPIKPSFLGKKRERIKAGINAFDRRLLDTQEKAYDRYEDKFSINLSLFLVLLSGAAFAFVGYDCYGMITIGSPIVVFMAVFSAAVLFQTFITLPLSAARIFKYFAVFYFTNTLVSELWGLYSMEFFSDLTNPCKPVLYANSFYGLVRAIVPDLTIIMICFTGNTDEKSA